MASAFSFQTQLVSIMDALTKAAVMEIGKLVEIESKMLKIEINRGRNEIASLTEKLQLMEKLLYMAQTQSCRRDSVAREAASAASRVAEADRTGPAIKSLSRPSEAPWESSESPSETTSHREDRDPHEFSSNPPKTQPGLVVVKEEPPDVESGDTDPERTVENDDAAEKASSLFAEMTTDQSDAEEDAASENSPDGAKKSAVAAAALSLFSEMEMDRPDPEDDEDPQVGQSYLVKTVETESTFRLFDASGRSLRDDDDDEDAANVAASGADNLDEHEQSLIPFEEDEDEHIEFPLAAEETPKKKTRVGMSRPKGRGRQSSTSYLKIPVIGLPCDSHRCPKKCTMNFSDDRRKEIFDAYWSMNQHERKSWVFNSVSRGLKRRNTTGGAQSSRRSMTNSYHLETDDGQSHEVCKAFFIATLGYHPKNDRFITTAMRSGAHRIIWLVQ